MNSIRPQMTMLNREDCLRLHQASLQILRQTGVQVFSEEALELLRQAGAVVDGNLVKKTEPLHSGNVVRIYRPIAGG